MTVKREHFSLMKMIIKIINKFTGKKNISEQQAQQYHIHIDEHIINEQQNQKKQT